mgnify:CR=1 FL=1
MEADGNGEEAGVVRGDRDYLSQYLCGGSNAGGFEIGDPECYSTRREMLRLSLGGD